MLDFLIFPVRFCGCYKEYIVNITVIYEVRVLCLSHQSGVLNGVAESGIYSEPSVAFRSAHKVGWVRGKLLTERGRKGNEDSSSVGQRDGLAGGSCINFGRQHYYSIQK